MKVFVAAPSFGRFGGIEAFTLSLASALNDEQGVECRFAIRLTRGAEADRELMTASEKVPGFLGCARFGLHQIGAWVGWADIVHVNNPMPDFAFSAMVLHKPYVVTMHNRNIARGSLRGWLWTAGARAARRRYYNSEFVRGTWEEQPFTPNSRVVRTGTVAHREYRPLHDRRGFLFLGRIIANKGVDLLIKAYANSGLDPVEHPLTIAGDGSLRSELEALVARRDIRGVTFLGFVSEEQKWRIIGSARWIVVPPHTNEDMGLTAIEARSRGVPCVVTKDGGLPEVAGEEAIVCRPGDVADLSAALVRAAEMKAEEYEKRCRAAFDGVKAVLTPWSFYAREYREVLGSQ
jgi:glycosyltransferase involved in cell wall biosynthesis